ncbi:hypothetical protein LguiB_017146 [Lonicera macranthoides]
MDEERNESDDQSNQEILINSNLITLKIHHGGEFRDMHHLEYVGGKIDIRNSVDLYLISTLEIKDIAQNIGCVRINRLAYKDPSCVGLRVLETDNDIINMISLVPAHRSINVYIGHSGYNNEFGVNSQISEEVNGPFWGMGGSFTELILSENIPIGLEEDDMGSKGGEEGEEGTNEGEDDMGSKVGEEGEDGTDEGEDNIGGKCGSSGPNARTCTSARSTAPTQVRKRKVSNASGSGSGNGSASTTARNASGSSSKTIVNNRVRKEINQFKPPRVANKCARGSSHGPGTQSSGVLDL